MSISFLMCSERSGSNFLTKLLNGHSNICGPSTKHIINPVVRNLFRYEPLENELKWEELLNDICNLMNVSFSIWKNSFSIDDLRLLAPVGDIASLLRNIFYEEAKANSKQHVFVKENHLYEFAFFLLIHFPESKYIYLVRDPRDMALSWKKNSDHPGGVVRAAKQWKIDQQNFLKIFNELNNLKKASFVRYEDLITHPRQNIHSMLKVLGLPYEENILNFYKDDLTQKNSKKQKAWGNLSKSIMSTNKDKYINELSSEEILAIEKICYFEMIQLDYKPQNSIDILKDFSRNRIEDIEKEENEIIQVERSDGVKANMEAKKIFYQKLFSIN